MKVIYYYYYLFYSKILADNEPHLISTLALSTSQAFLIKGILDILIGRYVCVFLNSWFIVGIALFLVLVNYLYYHKNGRAKRIVKIKPKFFSSHKISIILSILFFIITVSFLFWGPIYEKHLLEVYCK